ncbi:MAG: exodeoxyribonuclease VII large subunit, partial [Bdellovibrionales bacterium]|nr:exodeoxyribonuclease VII large subunit [Bdellovibrionales bacterium]
MTDYLTVSTLNRLFNTALEREFPSVDFEAEISQISRPASGHLYLTLKDEQSQLAGVLWRGTAAKIGFELEPGMAVLCHGRPNVYQGTGRLQVVISRIVLAGEGLLQKKFLELKAKLEKEGLFAQDRKRQLPFLPKAVGVVTSASGAVIKDIMVKIHERMPPMQVYLVPVRVQGEGAAAEIASAIKLLNESELVDVIIVGRGGGSLEDLWAFNEEIVVRAIFASRIPVVSGVGHEVDIALSDLVADLRAPTPTAAAEMVVPKRKDLLARILELEGRFKDTSRWLRPKEQGVDEFELRLNSTISNMLTRARLKVATYEGKLGSLEPKRFLALLNQRIILNQDRMFAILIDWFKNKENELGRLELRLRQAVSLKYLKGLDDNLVHASLLFEKSFARLLEKKKSNLLLLESRMSSV